MSCKSQENFPRLPGSHLSDSDVIENQHWKSLAVLFGRTRWGDVKKHWLSVIQPCLLQYYSGTLHLHILPQLMSHLNGNYKDFSKIDWTEVLKKKDFKGQTVFTLKKIFTNLKTRAQRSTGEKLTELKMDDIVKFSTEIKETRKENRNLRIINYFTNKISDLKVDGFITC